MERLDAVVVGAGVVGLAVARALALAGREVVVLEAEGLIGSGASSRNSEVIHAGIYYQPGSLKARLCVRGRDLLYDYAAAMGVGHARLTKLIVACDDAEAPKLDGIAARASENGVDDLRPLSGAEACALEPELACVAALLSPSTGIVDSHGLMLAYQGEAEARGAMIAFETPVLGGLVGEEGVRLRTGGASPMEIAARAVVNCAGLGAQALARGLVGLGAAHRPGQALSRGCYFTLSGRAPFSRLIYPLPDDAGLGVHVTLDLSGRCRFGPDSEWIETPSYDVDPARAEVMYPAIRRYWPALPDGAIEPDYAGVRTKISRGAAGQVDFMIEGPEAHGVPGLVNLFGIESPGLTASLAIAEEVMERLGQ